MLWNESKKRSSYRKRLIMSINEKYNTNNLCTYFLIETLSPEKIGVSIFQKL